MIRDAVDADLPAIVDIQNALLDTSTHEWTETPHTVEEKRAWLRGLQDAGHAVLVAVDGVEVVGFAAYGDFRDTAKWPGYLPCVEHTVHVRASHWGAGIGRALVDAVAERARAAGKHVVIAGIDSANVGSIRFHERLGFVEVARMPEIGIKFGRRLDLVLMQRVLE